MLSRRQRHKCLSVTHDALVAEGVEDEAQLDMLRDMDCDQAQGFYFSRPLPEQDAIALFQTEALSAQA